MIEPCHGWFVEDEGDGDPTGENGGGETGFEGEGVEGHSFAVGCGDLVEYLFCLFVNMICKSIYNQEMINENDDKFQMQ